MGAQTFNVRFRFDDSGLEVVLGKQEEETENAFVGGKNRWEFDSFTNWEFWWPSFPVLVYFKVRPLCHPASHKSMEHCWFLQCPAVNLLNDSNSLKARLAVKHLLYPVPHYLHSPDAALERKCSPAVTCLVWTCWNHERLDYDCDSCSARFWQHLP